MWNVGGQVVPMLAAVVAIPVLIRHLGGERFGVLTLGWAAIGYFSLFDFGLGRALTQAVASRLGGDTTEQELSEIAWTSLGVMLALGVLGGAVLAALTPYLVRSGVRVPADLVPETRTAFLLLAASLPWVVTTAGLRGVLEAHEDFALATALRVPLSIFTFVGPLLVLPFSSSLAPIIGILVAVRGVTWLAHLLVCLDRYPYLRGRPAVRARAIVPLLRYGGWMTVSNVVSPLMAYLDRFLVAAVLPIVAVAHYVTPYEVVTRLSIIPQGIVGAHFPAFASTFARDGDRTAALFARTFRAILLLMFPVVLVVVLFAREGLTAWVGADFAAAATPVLRWLGVGMFINALAYAPSAVLQATGRPDLTGRLHLVELPFYLAALYWLATNFGITGVAMTWAFRASVDAVALMLLADRNVPGERRQLAETSAVAALAVLAFGAASALVSLPIKLVFLGAVLAVFVLLGWTRVMAPTEREALRRWARASPGR